MRWIGIPVLAGCLMASASVQAADLIVADPWEIIHLAREVGPAEVSRDALRDPVIEASFDAHPYQISFYGCYLGRHCTAVLFQSRLSKPEWEKKPPRARLLGDWNRQKLFGKAYLDDENRAVLEHSVMMEAGIAPDTLRAALKIWLSALREYSDHLDF